MIKKLILALILVFSTIQVGFSAYWFIFSELNGYAIPREPVDWVRRFELIGSIWILVAFIGLLLGMIYGIRRNGNKQKI